MFDRMTATPRRIPAAPPIDGELRYVPESTRLVRITEETFREMLRRGIALRGVRVGPQLFRVTVPAHFEVEA